MSDTGGGHRASAEALKIGFQQRFGNQFSIRIIDLLSDHLPTPLNRIPHLYPFLSNRALFLWKLLWQTSTHPHEARVLMELIARSIERPVSQVFIEYAPDLVISVHPLVHEITARCLTHLRSRPPLVTVVTDLASVYPLWFHPAVQRCYVASEAAYRHGMEAGLPPERLRMYGLPVRPAFAQPLPPQPILRQKLGLDSALPAVLLAGGGEGVGGVAQIAEALEQALVQDGQAIGQLVVICGRNRKLHRQLSARPWPMPTIICGFVENMPEWMAACDCIITKAGPGTIAEALICGLPLVLSSFIPGQEEGNVPFVVDNEVGVYCTEPAEIAEIIHGWFREDQEIRLRFAQNARRLGRPQATIQIVESIAELLTPRSSDQTSQV
jgi:1,2-diacylglycerol 3-beta-galactosyltransferase